VRSRAVDGRVNRPWHSGPGSIPSSSEPRHPTGLISVCFDKIRATLPGSRTGYRRLAVDNINMFYILAFLDILT
jgi:hypothetical protein